LLRASITVTSSTPVNLTEAVVTKAVVKVVMASKEATEGAVMVVRKVVTVRVGTSKVDMEVVVGDMAGKEDLTGNLVAGTVDPLAADTVDLAVATYLQAVSMADQVDLKDRMLEGDRVTVDQEAVSRSRVKVIITTTKGGNSTRRDERRLCIA